VENRRGARDRDGEGAELRKSAWQEKRRLVRHGGEAPFFFGGVDLPCRRSDARRARGQPVDIDAALV